MFDDAPVWALGLLIFCLRVCDVSIGTLRSLSIMQNRIPMAVLLGFLEVFVWVMAVSPVISRISTEPILAVAYAGGFAMGNAAGVWLERKLALGHVVVRVFTTSKGARLAADLRERGHVLTTFQGQGRNGPVTMLYITCTREHAREVVEVSLQDDPNAFYSIERSSGGIYGSDRDRRQWGGWLGGMRK